MFVDANVRDHSATLPIDLRFAPIAFPSRIVVNSRHTSTLSLLAGVLLTAGCGRNSGDVTALAETVIVGPEYTAQGIYVPDDTRRSLGLKVVAIDESEIAGTLELTLRIYATSPAVTRASALLSPDEAALLHVGQSLELVASEGASAIATVTAVNNQLEDVAGQVELLAEIKQDAPMPVGVFMTAKAVVGGTGIVTSVPRSALIEGVEGSFVYTVSGDRFVRTPVIVGALQDDVAEIREGLYSGDEVVSEPAMSLWLTELAAIKGGHACCAVPAKGR